MYKLRKSDEAVIASEVLTRNTSGTIDNIKRIDETKSTLIPKNIYDLYYTVKERSLDIETVIKDADEYWKKTLQSELNNAINDLKQYHEKELYDVDMMHTNGDIEYKAKSQEVDKLKDIRYKNMKNALLHRHTEDINTMAGSLAVPFMKLDALKDTKITSIRNSVMLSDNVLLTCIRSLKAASTTSLKLIHMKSWHAVEEANTVIQGCLKSMSDIISTLQEEFQTIAAENGPIHDSLPKKLQQHIRHYYLYYKNDNKHVDTKHNFTFRPCNYPKGLLMVQSKVPLCPPISNYSKTIKAKKKTKRQHDRPQSAPVISTQHRVQQQQQQQHQEDMHCNNSHSNSYSDQVRQQESTEERNHDNDVYNDDFVSEDDDNDNDNGNDGDFNRVTPIVRSIRIKRKKKRRRKKSRSTFASSSNTDYVNKTNYNNMTTTVDGYSAITDSDMNTSTYPWNDERCCQCNRRFRGLGKHIPTVHSMELQVSNAVKQTRNDIASSMKLNPAKMTKKQKGEMQHTTYLKNRYHIFPKKVETFCSWECTKLFVTDSDQVPLRQQYETIGLIDLVAGYIVT